MPWLKFDQLTPAQAVIAQQQLAKIDNVPELKRPKHRDFLVVDGAVKGSRLTPFTKAEAEKILGPREIPSKTSLHGWTGGPEKWHLNQD